MTSPRRRAAAGLRVSGAFRAFVLDQLDGVDEVTSRSMFGGVGLYRGDVFFGIIAGDTLYLKVDDETRREYEAAGMQPFKPYPGRSTTMRYYAVPVEVLESSVELVKWARKAVTVASRPPSAARGPRSGRAARAGQSSGQGESR
jgi:DNA transformation protein and related proteins